MSPICKVVLSVKYSSATHACYAKRIIVTSYHVVFPVSGAAVACGKNGLQRVGLAETPDEVTQENLMLCADAVSDFQAVISLTM